MSFVLKEVCSGVVRKQAKSPLSTQTQNDALLKSVCVWSVWMNIAPSNVRQCIYPKRGFFSHAYALYNEWAVPHPHTRQNDALLNLWWATPSNVRQCLFSMQTRSVVSGKCPLSGAIRRQKLKPPVHCLWGKRPLSGAILRQKLKAPVHCRWDWERCFPSQWRHPTVEIESSRAVMMHGDWTLTNRGLREREREREVCVHMIGLVWLWSRSLCANRQIRGVHIRWVIRMCFAYGQYSTGYVWITTTTPHECRTMHFFFHIKTFFIFCSPCKNFAISCTSQKNNKKHSENTLTSFFFYWWWWYILLLIQ